MKTIILRSALALVAAAGLTTLASADAEASTAQLVCESLPGSPGGALCDVFATGATSYAWSTSGGLRLTAGPANAQSRQVACVLGSSGGTVSVAITYGDGTHDSKSRPVGCAGPAL